MWRPMASEAVAPGDLAFARLVMALFNTLAMLGAFFLARELSGSSRGGRLGLGLAAVYPSFALQAGRLIQTPSREPSSCGRRSSSCGG